MAAAMTKAPPPKPPRKPRRTASAAPAQPRPRARGGEARRVADFVPAIGDTAFRKFGFVQSAIITRWPEIIGARLARVTAPESLRFPPGKKSDGLLSIAVAGAHGPLVQHVVPDIVASVNRFFGYAAVARVRLSPVVSLRRPAARPAASIAPPPAVPPVPSASITAIGDPELRAVLEGLASSLAKNIALPKIS